jgi:YD repeat-containing protein
LYDVTMAYSAEERTSVATYADGARTTYGYDATRVLTEVVSPLGAVRRFVVERGARRRRAGRPPATRRAGCMTRSARTSAASIRTATSSAPCTWSRPAGLPGVRAAGDVRRVGARPPRAGRRAACARLRTRRRRAGAVRDGSASGAGGTARRGSSTRRARGWRSRDAEGRVRRWVRDAAGNAVGYSDRDGRA